MVKGNKVCISVLGLRNQEFVVEDTVPEGFVSLKKDTVLEVLQTKKRGLKSQIKLPMRISAAWARNWAGSGK